MLNIGKILRFIYMHSFILHILSILVVCKFQSTYYQYTSNFIRILYTNAHFFSSEVKQKCCIFSVYNKFLSVFVKFYSVCYQQTFIGKIHPKNVNIFRLNHFLHQLLKEHCFKKCMYVCTWT